MACQTCRKLGVAHVTRSAGYIASVITSETQSSTSCGSSKCPWKIEVESGQTINLTLYDFALRQRAAGGSSSSGGVGYVSAENCFRYAVIKESPSHRSFPVCGGHGRTQFVYSSVTNVIEIHVVSPEVFSQKGQFLIYYEGTVSRRHRLATYIRPPQPYCRASAWVKHAEHVIDIAFLFVRPSSASIVSDRLHIHIVRLETFSTFS